MPLMAKKQLSQQSVSTFAGVIQQAMIKQELDQLMSYFNVDAVIQITLPKFMGGEIITTTKDYLAMLAISWNMTAEYVYEYKDLVIELAEDKQTATIKETVSEKMLLDGEVMTSTVAKQITRIKLIADKPMIVAINSNVRLVSAD